ncbi:MAG: radical SAM protein [bacterium]|nr:radical SAM protein [bacterium]
MKVFLGNAPWFTKGQPGVRAGSRWPHRLPPGSPYMPFPFYLAYATSVLEKAGYQVKLVDGIALHQSDREFIAEGKSFQPKVILLETATPTIDLDLEISHKLKSSCGHSIPVILTGPHASVFPEEILEQNPQIDFILIGEYEYTLLELVQKLAQQEPVESVAGLVYRGKNKEIIRTPRRPLIENIDELPWPAYQHLPMLNYNDDFGVLPKPMVQMWASRGCPFLCNFCLWPQVMYGNNRYRIRDPVKVVEEMEWLIKTYGFKAVYFDDDTFDLGKQRILQFCSELTRHGIKIPWAAMARADTLDQEMLNAMANAGLIAIKYGVESGVQELVDRCGKRLDLNKVVETVNRTKSAGIKVHLTFTFGLEGETKETIQQTIDFALALDPDSVQFSIITPFPGTKYYDELKEKGFLYATQWSDFDGNRSAVIRTEHLTTEDLISAFTRAYSVWNEYRDKKMRSRPTSIPLIENYNPSKEKETILILSYADAGVVLRCAKILRDKSTTSELTLLSHINLSDQQEIGERFNAIRTIPNKSGFKKVLTALKLLFTIRKMNYDLVVFLSDDANSFMRRFPLTLTYLSKAKNIIVTDANGCGYKVDKPFAYLKKMLAEW